MARLIDADALPYENQVLSYDDEWCLKVSEIENAPTVDAVEVVRCKDCKYMYERMSVCTKVKVRGEILHIRVEPDDFCSYGERRTNNG